MLSAQPPEATHFIHLSYDGPVGRRAARVLLCRALRRSRADATPLLLDLRTTRITLSHDEVWALVDEDLRTCVPDVHQRIGLVGRWNRHLERIQFFEAVTRKILDYPTRVFLDLDAAARWVCGERVPLERGSI